LPAAEGGGGREEKEEEEREEEVVVVEEEEESMLDVRSGPPDGEPFFSVLPSRSKNTSDYEWKDIC